MQIKQFDRDNVMDFKNAVEAKLQEIEVAFGVSLKVDKFNIVNRQSMTMSVTTSVGDDVRLEDTPGGRKFLAYCEFNGIPKDALGKSVMVNKTLYKLTGWVPSARKYCVEAERIMDGKVFRIDTRSVTQGLR